VPQLNNIDLDQIKSKFVGNNVSLLSYFEIVMLEIQLRSQ